MVAVKAGYRLWKYAGKQVDPFYLGRPWKQIRVYILQRDSYQCQICKKRWANTVHHIIPRSERPDLALDPDNLESVCRICHNQEHPEKQIRIEKEKRTPEGIRIIKV